MNFQSQARRVTVFLLASTLLSLVIGTTMFMQTGATATQFPTGSGSWNQRVPCSSPWIVRITDITDNMTGSGSLTSSIFNPGITSPVGTAKRWLTPGSTPAGWVSPGPPCTITNSHGTVALFVEVDGVKRGGITNEDCTGNYDTVNGGTSNGGSYCDSTFNIYDPTVVPDYSTSCSSSTDPTCYGRIHSEIDHDWKAAHYCGSSTTCDDAALGSQTTSSTLIDFQGFISWDPGNLNQQWHNFNGWEIHPLTAWRLHQSNPSLTASFTFTPSSPATNQAVTFTASASGGASPYTYNWSFGDGTTSTGNPATHSYSTAATYSAQLTVRDSVGATTSVTQSVTVIQSATPDFSILVSPTSLTIPSGSSATSSVTLTSLNGFAGTLSLSAKSSPIGPGLSLNPSSVGLSAGGSASSTLTVTSASAGSYSISVTASDGPLSHSASISVNVVDFSISSNPSSFSLSPGTSGTSTITLASLGGFGGTITLSPSVSPSGPTLSVSPTKVTLTSGGTGMSTLTVSTQLTTPIANYTVTITGSTSSLSRSTTVLVTVLLVPDFSLSATSPADFNSGGTGSSTITLTSIGSFNGKVTLNSLVTPSTGLGANCPASLSVASGTTTATCSLSSSTPGTYLVTITGSSGGHTHTTSFVSHVGDFSILTTSPLGAPGSLITSTISLTSQFNFAGTIALTDTVPAGLNCNPLSSASAILTVNGTATSTLSCSSTMLTAFIVNIDAAGSPGISSHSSSATFTFAVIDFSISANTSSITIPRSSSGSLNLTLTSLGFNGTVTLSVSVSASGPKTSLSQTSIVLSPGGSASSTLSVRALKKTPVGNYVVTIIATSGSLSHSITIEVTVT
jgi:PKD repeat protein